MIELVIKLVAAFKQGIGSITNIDYEIGYFNSLRPELNASSNLIII